MTTSEPGSAAMERTEREKLAYRIQGIMSLTLSVEDGEIMGTGQASFQSADMLLATIAVLTRERDETREALKVETPMDRSVQFQDGFRNAKRRCVAWLHTEAKRMNDPNAVAILNAAADHLGNSALAGGKQE